MNCSFCHGHSRTARRMSADEFLLVLDRLEGQTKYLYYHLMGEPLTHPLLPDFIREATSRGFKSVITTNGTLLSAGGRALIDAGVYKVSISLHSFEGDDGARHLQYLSDVADFAALAASSGVIVVLRLWNRGFDDGKNDTVLDFLRARFEGEEWTTNTRGIRIRDKLHIEWGERFEWPDLSARKNDGEIFCYGLCDHFGVLCDGTVVPCCLDSNGVLALGNIFDNTVEKILSSDRARAIAEGFAARVAAEELCRRCGYAQRFSREKSQ